MLDILAIDSHGPEDAIHNKISLLLILEVGACLRNCSRQGLDRNTCQFELLHTVSLLRTDVADHRVQDHADLLLVQLLVDVLVKELAEEAKGLDRGQTDVEVAIGRIFRHTVQEVVPVAVGDFESGDDCQVDGSILLRCTIMAT